MEVKFFIQGNNSTGEHWTASQYFLPYTSTGRQYWFMVMMLDC